MNNYGGPIEFRLGVSLLSRSNTLWVLAIVLGLPVLLLLAAVFIAAAGNGESSDIAEALVSAWNEVDKGDSLDGRMWLAAALIPVGVLVLMLQRACYLRLSGIGMEAHIPKWLGLGLFGLSTGHWEVRWDSIRTVRLLAGKHRGKPALDLGGYRLVVETGREQKRLAPQQHLCWARVHRCASDGWWAY